jgi:hypothetical protein
MALFQNEHLRSLLESSHIAYRVERIVENQRKKEKTETAPKPKVGAFASKLDSEYSSANLQSELNDPSPWSALSGDSSSDPSAFRSSDGESPLTQWEFVLNDFKNAVDGWIYGGDAFPLPLSIEPYEYPITTQIQPADAKVRFRIWERIYVPDDDLPRAAAIYQQLCSGGPARSNAYNLHNIDFALKSMSVPFCAILIHQYQFQRQSDTQASAARTKLGLVGKADRSVLL